MKFPWLKQGGDEWHAFSFYLREATHRGLSAARPSIIDRLSAAPLGGGRGTRYSSVAQPVALTRSTTADEEAALRNKRLRERADEEANLEIAMESVTRSNRTHVSAEARERGPQFTTTQCFIMPAGDWTRRLSEAIQSRDGAARHRACWVRGPYPSPFAIAADFSQLILFASGIGITPALAVMGQYRGNARIKVRPAAQRRTALLWKPCSEALL